MFVDPVKTHCCSKTYCNDCITNALIETDLTCPNCDTQGILIDNLIPDEETALKIKSYIEEKERSKSPSVKAYSNNMVNDDKTVGKKADKKKRSLFPNTDGTKNSPIPPPDPDARKPAWQKKRPAEDWL